MANTLHMTLKRKWFDMMLLGVKKEEYREQKDYWYKRLTNIFEANYSWDNYSFKEYDTITFRNGYSKNASEFVIEFKGTSEGYGNPVWGAPIGESVFIISVGNILSTKNIKPND